MKKLDINSMKVIKVSKKTLNKFIEVDPYEFFRDPENVTKALAMALLDGDKQSFYEILTVYLKLLNKEELSRRSKVPIATIRRMAAGANFNVDTLLKITHAISKAA